MKSIVDKVEESRADVVLFENTKNGRYAAACLAAEHGTSAVPDVSDVRLSGNQVLAKRVVDGMAVLCPVAGLMRAETERPCTNVVELPASMPDGLEFVSCEPKTVQKVGLQSAKRVLGIGRGVKGEEGLREAEAFAAKLGAELGCTRPVAEEDKLLPRERYIGVSGASIRPRLYVASGISGQVQHMVGVGDSEVIVAINKDKQAPILKNCDFGIVGDAVEVMRALKSRL